MLVCQLLISLIFFFLMKQNVKGNAPLPTVVRREMFRQGHGFVTVTLPPSAKRTTNFFDQECMFFAHSVS